MKEVKEVNGEESGQAHRKLLQQALGHYLARFPNEGETVARIRTLVAGHPDCFERTCLPGHITGSAWIVSPDRSRYLMTRHRIFDRWLQLGGHSDGCAQPHLVALREAEEESGLTGFGLYREPEGFVPLDVDIHTIAARAGVPAHAHYDIRYLLTASDEKPLIVSDESHDLRWFDSNELMELIQEESVLRMARKGVSVLEGHRGEFVYDYT